MRARRPVDGPGRDLQGWFSEHDPLVLVADRNPVLETLGHDPRTAAAEAAWLHRLGPAAMAAHRRLVALLEVVGDGHAVPLQALAHDVGLPGGTGRSAKICRTLARLVDWGIATPRGEALAVTFALPPARRLHRRLEDELAPPSRDLPAPETRGLRSGPNQRLEASPEVRL